MKLMFAHPIDGVPDARKVNTMFPVNVGTWVTRVAPKKALVAACDSDVTTAPGP